MNNAAKHSQGDLVLLNLGKRRNQIAFRVQDNGVGFEQENCQKGLGLASMKERAQHSGGLFTLESYPGKGTCLEVIWPA